MWGIKKYPNAVADQGGGGLKPAHTLNFVIIYNKILFFF